MRKGPIPPQLHGFEPLTAKRRAEWDNTGYVRLRARIPKGGIGRYPDASRENARYVTADMFKKGDAHGNPRLATA